MDDVIVSFVLRMTEVLLMDFDYPKIPRFTFIVKTRRPANFSSSNYIKKGKSSSDSE